MTATMTTLELEARRDRGIAWLDEHDPGWWKVDQPPGYGEDGGPIDLDGLSMKHPCYCIFGQRLGSYYLATISLDDAVACGFDSAAAAEFGEVTDANYTEWQQALDDEFEALTELWRQTIQQRRAGVDR